MKCYNSTLACISVYKNKTMHQDEGSTLSVHIPIKYAQFSSKNELIQTWIGREEVLNLCVNNIVNCVGRLDLKSDRLSGECIVLNLCLDHVRGINLESDSFPCKFLHKNLFQIKISLECVHERRK